MEVVSKLLITQGFHLLDEEYAKKLIGAETRTSSGRIFNMRREIVKDKIEDLWVLIEDSADGLELFGVFMRNWG